MEPEYALVTDSMESYLQKRLKNDYPQVDMITCLGTVELYIRDHYSFIKNAMKCLRPEGAFIMSGMGRGFADIFNNYNKLGYNGIITKNQHSWDEFAFCCKKQLLSTHFFKQHV